MQQEDCAWACPEPVGSLRQQFIWSDRPVLAVAMTTPSFGGRRNFRPHHRHPRPGWHTRVEGPQPGGSDITSWSLPTVIEGKAALFKQFGGAEAGRWCSTPGTPIPPWRVSVAGYTALA